MGGGKPPPRSLGRGGSLSPAGRGWERGENMSWAGYEDTGWKFEEICYEGDEIELDLEEEE